MMKYLFTLILLMTAAICTAQHKKSIYVEITGNVDVLGNIVLLQVSKPKASAGSEQLFNYQAIEKIVALREAIAVINQLAVEGWTLVTCTQVTSDKEARPNSAFVVYYFKKEMEQ